VPIDIRPALQRALKQLQSERARLDQQIAALGDAIGAVGGRGARTVSAGGAKVARRRARPKMTAEQKKAVSRRMKAYWAKRRSAKTAAK
jgi:peptidoglycan hydrolase CwlO-like protein